MNRCNWSFVILVFAATACDRSSAEPPYDDGYVDGKADGFERSPDYCRIDADEDGDSGVDAVTHVTYAGPGRPASTLTERNGVAVRNIIRAWDGAGRQVGFQQWVGVGDELKLTYESRDEYDAEGRHVKQLEDKRGDGLWDIEHRWSYGAAHDEPTSYEGGRHGNGHVGTSATFQYEGDPPRVLHEVWRNEAGEVYETRSYAYDAAGRLVLYHVEQQTGAETPSVSETLHTYDAIGNLLTTVQRHDGVVSARETFEYAPNGQLLEHRLFDAADALAGHARFQYDDVGLVWREELDGSFSGRAASAADGTIDTVTLHGYDQNRRPLWTEWQDGRDVVQARWDYGYDCQ